MDVHISKELRRINHLLAEMNGAYHEAAVRLGLSDSVMQVLYALCSAGDPCPLQTIVRLSGVSKQTINSAIRKLEREGAVRLEAAEGRGKNVRLTPEGQALARRTVLPLMEIEDEIYASWTGEELAEYLALNERYLAALKEKTKRL